MRVGSRALLLACAAAPCAGLNPLPARAFVRRLPTPLKARRASPAHLASAPTDRPTSTMSTSVFNVVKGALGAGALSLPYGCAVIGDTTKVLAPASAIVVGLGVVSAYTFSLTAR